MPTPIRPVSTLTAAVFLSLFVLSGFAGLIYQSVWTQYLGLLLGHAAYAQALVLSIFMGGLALGAWIAARYSMSVGNLLVAYAVCEALIGLAGLLFHDTYVAVSSFNYQVAMPGLAGSGLASAWNWLSAGLMIFPQCILLGATFPLISAALLRLEPSAMGSTLGGLYFANSAGAVVGVLAATFYLLPKAGMPGTLYTAGITNILVAIVAYAFSLSPFSRAETGKPTASESQPPSLNSSPLLKILLTCTLLSGAFSFVYEIGWIRLLNQSLGSSVHSFELMLAAFILGLALGGLWVRNRGDSIRDVVAAAGYAQIAMGICALASLILFAHSFDIVGWLMQSIQRNDSGYDLFLAGSAILAIAVMLPAAFFAGMTLPLFTVALLKEGHSEQAIGRVYAANTLGAILGVVVVIFALIPLLGVALSVTLAAIGDVVIGLYLLRRISPGRVTPKYVAGALSAAVVLVLAFTLGQPEPLKQAGGVFRTGQASLDESYEVHFLRDGRTSTVSVHSDKERTTGSIATNGKSDASLSLALNQQPSDDEITMLMLGALPLALHRSPEQVAVIGWGSGLSTHTILGSSRVKRVESIEIEPAMYAGARLFGDRVIRAYLDPRSKVYFDDARHHFAAHNRKYDVIISEPSNPWVSGVSNLFTKEFYHSLHNHLNGDGLLIQWLHTYELSDELLATMVAALLDSFEHIKLYEISYGDLVLAASNSPIPEVSFDNFQDGPLKSELVRVGIAHTADISLRELADETVLAAFIRSLGASPHSDYFPTVALNAPRARYKRQTANLLPQIVWSGMPIFDILTGNQSAPAGTPSSPSSVSTIVRQRGTASAIASALASTETGPLLNGQSAATLALLLATRPEPDADAETENNWLGLVASMAQDSIGFLPREDLERAWVKKTWWPETDSVRLTAANEFYTALAARDLTRLRDSSSDLLDVHSQFGLPSQVVAQALSMAMTISAKAGDSEAVRDWDTRFGMDAGSHLFAARIFLLAWADQAVSSPSTATAPSH